MNRRLVPWFGVWVFLGLAFGSLSGQAVEGATLTLGEGKVVFKDGAVTEEYALEKVPGLKMMSYSPKFAFSAKQMTDISQLTLGNEGHVQVMLLMGLPQKVMRSKGADGTVTWVSVP